MWELQYVPRITLFLKNTKQYNHLSYTFFKVVPVCNCTPYITSLNVTIKLCPRGSYMETVLGRESAELAVIHEGYMLQDKLRNTVLQWGKIQIFLCEVRQTASQLVFPSYGSHLENQLCQTTTLIRCSYIIMRNRIIIYTTCYYKQVHVKKIFCLFLNVQIAEF